MRRLIAALPLALLTATPAQATGGFVCRTAGSRPIQVNVAFGHVAGAALLQDATRLSDNGRPIAVTAPQWWFDGTELRLLLADRTSQRTEALIKTNRRGRTFDGSLWRNGLQHWIRCRED